MCGGVCVLVEQEAGGCACLVARVNIRDDPLAGDVAVGLFEIPI
jgi:hypothetical protein